jgi:hypothetical protein
MVKSTIIILGSLCFLYSCFPIYNKKNLLPKNEIGIKNSSFAIDGYYYRESQDTLYHKYNIQRNGSYDKSKSFNYYVKYIVFYLFDKDGYIYHGTAQTSYPYKLDSVNFYTYERLHDEIKKEIANLKNIKAGKWKNGVYKVDNDNVLIQEFYQGIEEYHLLERRGKIKEHNIEITEKYNYKNDREETDILTYKFYEYPIPSFPNYIKENPKKFWKQ